MLGIHPWKGNFRLYFGLSLDYILELYSNNLISFISSQKNINIDESIEYQEIFPDDLPLKMENVNKTSSFFHNYIYPIKLVFIYGIDYLFPFGFRLGWQNTISITSFLKQENYEYYGYTSISMTLSLGIDVARLIEFYSKE